MVRGEVALARLRRVVDDDAVRRLLNGIAAARLGLPRALAPGGDRCKAARP
ncbi:MAG TPA: hypothetical protein VEX11_07835 [Acetobacteraceae bacterium]|jgi:hypothetical protein|nr:hypothetical protein [Acetobacteraceae bacterium]